MFGPFLFIARTCVIATPPPHEYNGDINGHNHPAQQPSGTVHTPDRLTGLIEQVEAAIVLCAWNTRTPC
jgi:hypothetical protein